MWPRKLFRARYATHVLAAGRTESVLNAFETYFCTYSKPRVRETRNTNDREEKPTDIPIW